MHIILGLLSGLLTLLYILDRLNIDIGWFNPFAWRRRRDWRKKVDTNPVLTLDDPLEVAAVLIAATAKINGDISLEEKNEILAIYEHELKQNSTDASALLRSSVYLIELSNIVFDSPKKVLQTSIDNFSDSQKFSTLNMIERVANIGDDISAAQQDFIRKIKVVFDSKTKASQW